MKFSKLCFGKTKLMALFLLVTSLPVQAAGDIEDYTLEQVIIFSRHGLRAPLATPSSALGQLTSHQWPQWETPASYLTIKGGVLESYFGHYLQEWLVDNKLLNEKTCPTKKDIFFYANSMQRTIATAQYLALGGFPGCDVTIFHKEKINTMDPLFSLNIQTDNEQFKQQAMASIIQQAGEGGINGLNQRLKPTYQKMEQVIDYQGASACTGINQCHLNNLDAEIKIVKGQEPAITGPLRIGTSLSDAFILQYYEGTPIQNVGWGKIQSLDELEQLISVKEYYNSVIFGAPAIANYVAKNLLTYIDNTFTNSENKPKVTVLVGHDSNVASLLAALKITPYQLPNQFETTPIGGKLFFERWKNPKTGQEFIKIEYVYQTTEQIVNATMLNRQNPPQKVTLKMTDCPTDNQGYCQYTTFKSYLDNLTQ